MQSTQFRLQYSQQPIRLCKTLETSIAKLQLGCRVPTPTQRSLPPALHEAWRLVRAPGQGSPADVRQLNHIRTHATFSLPSLLPLSSSWGVWSALVLAGAAGLWSEKTKLGKELSGALVATLAGMALANTGVLPAHAPELQVVYKYLLPLAIPLLLLAADLRRILNDTGRLLGAFLLGSACTVFGTVVAFSVFPLGQYLGADGWRIAAALTARHIGGAVNYMAVSETLSIAPSTFGAGLAADDLILTLYFTSIYALAKGIPSDAGPAVDTVVPPGHGVAGGKTINVQDGLTALALSAFICYFATQCAAHWGMASQSITVITAITVTLATLFPQYLSRLVPSAEGLAQILMQVFYATIGASANVGLVMNTAPVLFLFSLIALAAHLGSLLFIGNLLGFSRRELLLASNANIGGPSTVAGMAAAKGWNSSIVPAILTSTLGYAIGTFIGIALGQKVLWKM